MSIISEQDVSYCDSTLDNHDDISECSTICTFESSCELAPQRQRKVQFASHAYCRYTISRYEMTLDEALKTWIFADEKSEMMSGYSKTAERMKSGKKPKRNSSYRGLECFHSADADELRETIKSCVDAVLEEQGNRLKQEPIEWKHLAKVAKKHSKPSIKLALKRAKEDEKEAKKAYRRMELDPQERNSRHSNRSYSARTFFAVPERIQTGSSQPRSILKMEPSCITETSLDSTSAEVLSA